MKFSYFIIYYYIISSSLVGCIKKLWVAPRLPFSHAWGYTQSLKASLVFYPPLLPEPLILVSADLIFAALFLLMLLKTDLEQVKKPARCSSAPGLNRHERLSWPSSTDHTGLSCSSNFEAKFIFFTTTFQNKCSVNQYISSAVTLFELWKLNHTYVHQGKVHRSFFWTRIYKEMIH